LTLPIKARGERLLGIAADTLVYSTYFITNGFTFDLSIIPNRPKWLRRICTAAVLCWAAVRYQRFHFFYDRGLLDPVTRFEFNPRELDLLRYLGKELFFYAYGADVRTNRATQRLGAPNCCTACPGMHSSCICDDAIGAANYERICQTATEVFSLGDMIHYTPGSRNDLFYWPIDLGCEDGRKYAPRYPDPAAAGPVRIVHAPNHRFFKGTSYLLDAVVRLQAEGFAVELQLVEKVPNDHALEIYRSADIVFDQCLIGFHGYFALEALALGKPVMVFIRDPERYLLSPRECPFINTPADRVTATLRELLQDRPKLHALGVQGRRYIEKYFSLEAFAARLATVYRDLSAGRAVQTNTGEPVGSHVS
jgi:hypothetical protein